MLRCPSASTPGIPNPHGLTLWNCHEEIQNQGTSSKRKHETLTTLSMFTPIYWKVKTECAGGCRHQVAAAYDTQVTRHKCMGQHLNTSFANQKRILTAKSNISKQSIVLLRKKWNVLLWKTLSFPLGTQFTSPGLKKTATENISIRTRRKI